MPQSAMKRRNGFTVIEITAAIALLAVCAVSFAQLVALVASERASTRMQQTAHDQVQNVMEYLAGTDPEKLAAGDFDKAPFESLIERSLPDGKIVFETKPFEPDSAIEQDIAIEPDRAIVTVTVSWHDGDNRPRRKVAMFRLLHLPTPSEDP